LKTVSSTKNIRRSNYETTHKLSHFTNKNLAVRNCSHWTSWRWNFIYIIRN